MSRIPSGLFKLYTVVHNKMSNTHINLHYDVFYSLLEYLEKRNDLFDIVAQLIILKKRNDSSVLTRAYEHYYRCGVFSAPRTLRNGKKYKVQCKIAVDIIIKKAIYNVFFNKKNRI